MSILESDRLDGLATTNNENTLAMLISDHLDFENEHEHLFALQNKINSYIAFIEEKEDLFNLIDSMYVEGEEEEDD